jgi:hypothetical protein
MDVKVRSEGKRKVKRICNRCKRMSPSKPPNASRELRCITCQAKLSDQVTFASGGVGDRKQLLEEFLLLLLYMLSQVLHDGGSIDEQASSRGDKLLNNFASYTRKACVQVCPDVSLRFLKRHFLEMV